MAANMKDEELSLMLLGITGAGKSATGNTILGGRYFQESSGTSSKTKVVTSKFARFDNFIIKIVDCPGLMGTDVNNGEDKEKAVENMATAIAMCNGGVDAFLLVTKRCRFTEEHKKSLEAHKTILGDKYLDNLIVVVTEGDRFREDMKYEGCGDKDFHTWCREQTGVFKQLYEGFSDRILLINNRETDPDTNNGQRRKIIQLARSLQIRNGRYASICFQKAKALQDKLIVEENLPILNETIQSKVGLLASDLLKLQESPSNSERKRILQSVDDLTKEIVQKDRGTGLLNKLLTEVKSVETTLHDVDGIHKLAMILEAIREEEASWSKVGKKATTLKLVSGVIFAVAATALLFPTSPFVLPVATVALHLSVPSYIVGRNTKFFSCRQSQVLSQIERHIQSEKTELESKVKKDTGQ